MSVSAVCGVVERRQSLREQVFRYVRQVELLSNWLSRRGQGGETCAHRELLDGARESDVLGLALFGDGVEGHYVAWFVVLQRAPEASREELQPGTKRVARPTFSRCLDFTT